VNTLRGRIFAERRQACFSRQHLSVGSGVIEASCKTVIGSRLKQSGMFWTVRGATPSSPCDVAPSTIAWRIIGSAAGRLDFHFCNTWVWISVWR
jgi:hypothetical protein